MFCHLSNLFLGTAAGIPSAPPARWRETYWALFGVPKPGYLFGETETKKNSLRVTTPEGEPEPPQPKILCYALAFGLGMSKHLVFINGHADEFIAALLIFIYQVHHHQTRFIVVKKLKRVAFCRG